MSRRVVGFTGTREGMALAQAEVVSDLLVGAAEFHHGDCIGSDVGAHALAKICGARTVSHPPTNERFRAFTDNNETRDPLPYFDRNNAIVDESDELMAAPGSHDERVRGGTWYTVRRARQFGKPITIVWLDGSVKRENHAGGVAP